MTPNRVTRGGGHKRKKAKKKMAFGIGGKF